MKMLVTRLYTLIEAKERQIKKNLIYFDTQGEQEEVRELKSIVMSLEEKLHIIRNVL